MRRGDRLKQRLKNGVYRAIGEAAAAVARADGEGGALRVLLYHKVNDVPGNPLTVPVSVFGEQMAQLGELGYRPVSLDDVLAQYRRGEPLPSGAVLITFDDGYRDNLENAAPVLRRHGYPAVVFVPVGYLDDPRSLPHEEPLGRRGLVNRLLAWEDLPELEASGIRVESHGIGHRPLAELDRAAAEREVADSKRRLEERLGRPVRAFAFVKGSRAHYSREHVDLLRRAGYELGFTTVTGANGRSADPFQLRRYNVEPYPARTFELVLSGACDLLRVKDTAVGTRVRRALNAALGTSSR